MKQGYGSLNLLIYQLGSGLNLTSSVGAGGQYAPVRRAVSDNLIFTQVYHTTMNCILHCEVQ